MTASPTCPCFVGHEFGHIRSFRPASPHPRYPTATVIAHRTTPIPGSTAAMPFPPSVPATTFTRKTLTAAFGTNPTDGAGNTGTAPVCAAPPASRHWHDEHRPTAAVRWCRPGPPHRRWRSLSDTPRRRHRTTQAPAPGDGREGPPSWCHHAFRLRDRLGCPVRGLAVPATRGRRRRGGPPHGCRLLAGCRGRPWAGFRVSVANGRWTGLSGATTDFGGRSRPPGGLADTGVQYRSIRAGEYRFTGERRTAGGTVMLWHGGHRVTENFEGTRPPSTRDGVRPLPSAGETGRPVSCRAGPSRSAG